MQFTLARDLATVHIIGVFIIVGCPQGESCLYLIMTIHLEQFMYLLVCMATMGTFQETEGKPISIHFKMNSCPPGPS